MFLSYSFSFFSNATPYNQVISQNVSFSLDILAGSFAYIFYTLCPKHFYVASLLLFNLLGVGSWI